MHIMAIYGVPKTRFININIFIRSGDYFLLYLWYFVFTALNLLSKGAVI